MKNEKFLNRYLLEGESKDEFLERVAGAYGSSKTHAKRMRKYIEEGWFLPASPILTNAGTDRGLPISCFLSSIDDDLNSIVMKIEEAIRLGAAGGGLGVDFSKLRGIGEKIAQKGKSSGAISFMKIFESATTAINQGSLRRGAAAAYLHVSHPEIEEFVSIRLNEGGDENRKCPHLHHGISIDDDFMEAVEKGEKYNLVDPHSGEIVKGVDARDLFIKIIETRAKRGEPYILFVDNANAKIPEKLRKIGYEITQSNLCSEILQHTGIDWHGKDRTAVCCLGSVNVEYYLDWYTDENFIFDCIDYLDNVLSDFIKKTKKMRGFESANYSATRERSIGLGLMGLHSFFMRNKIPYDGIY